MAARDSALTGLGGRPYRPGPAYAARHRTVEPAAPTPSGRGRMEPGASGTDYGERMAEDLDIRQRITDLVGTERTLREQLAGGEISTAEEHERLRRVETELDQCWDLLRQRQALRDAGGDPSAAAARSEGTVEGYLG